MQNEPTKPDVLEALREAVRLTYTPTLHTTSEAIEEILRLRQIERNMESRLSYVEGLVSGIMYRQDLEKKEHDALVAHVDGNTEKTKEVLQGIVKVLENKV